MTHYLPLTRSQQLACQACKQELTMDPSRHTLVLLQPVYEALFGFHVFGLGFVTSMAFIFCTGNAHIFTLHTNTLLMLKHSMTSISAGLEP